MQQALNVIMHYEVTVRGAQIPVRVYVEDIRIIKDGIGPYEFWGQKCYDAGRRVIDEYIITGIDLYEKGRKLSPRLKEVIKKILYNDDMFFDLLSEGVSEWLE